MKPLIPIVIAVLTAGSLARADPATRPSADFKQIGAGLYVRKEDEADVDDRGNLTLPVYSPHGIVPGGNYAFDSGLSSYMFRFDGGAFGTLVRNEVTVDCKNQTYRSHNYVDGGPEIWRTTSSLPGFALVFQYACSHKWSQRETRQQAQEPQGDRQLVERPPVPSVPPEWGNTKMRVDYQPQIGCVVKAGTPIQDHGPSHDYRNREPMDFITLPPGVCEELNMSIHRDWQFPRRVLDLPQK